MYMYMINIHETIKYTLVSVSNFYTNYSYFEDPKLSDIYSHNIQVINLYLKLYQNKRD